MTPLSLVPEQARHRGISYGELVERIIAEALVSAARVKRGGGAGKRKPAPRVSAKEDRARSCPSARRAPTAWRAVAFGLSLRDRRGRADRARHSVEGDDARPAKRSAAPASRSSGSTSQGIRHMDSTPVYEIALDQKTMAMPLVDVHAIREQLLTFGWVKDARVSRRLPDTLVIDIVEREPAALWQDKQQARADRQRGRRPRPRSGRQDARPAVADRPRRQRQRAGA